MNSTINRDKIIRAAFCIVFATMATTGLDAQGTAVSVRDSVNSSVLHQNRQIEIFLPPGGLKEGRRYDVFYVLDGEWNIKLVREIMDFLVSENMMPPQIIVSVLNGEPDMRDRDFTPTHTPDNALSGHADNFISFLRYELRPHIDGKYPVSGHNTLFGHSFGGLFGMYALLTEPALFDAYILGDPSFWWDNHYMYGLTISRLKQINAPLPALFILGRKGDFDDPAKKLDAAGMDSVLKSISFFPSKWKILTSPDETHTSTKLRTVVEGLRFIFKGYNGSPLQVNPTSGGIVLAGKPFMFYVYQTHIEAFHYNLDGREPTEHSHGLLWKELLTLDSSSDLKIRSFTTRPDLSQTISEHFEAGTSIPPETKPKGNWMRDSTFNLGKIQADDAGWKKFTGYLEITQSGYYFMTMQDGAAVRWYLGKKLVMASDTAASNGRFQSVIVPLEKGFYFMHIEVKGKDPGKDPVLFYNTPTSDGNGLFLLPDMLYLKKGKHNAR